MDDPVEEAELGAAAEVGHQHLDAVELPDGPTIWGATFPAEDYRRERLPDFGLYMDPRWKPPWPHAHLDWPDLGLPVDGDAFAGALNNLLRRVRSGAMVEIGCLGGHGRTGTALACIAIEAGLTQDPVEWVRSVYCPRAVETEEQESYVRRFSTAH